MGISRPSRALPEQTDAESLQPNKRLKLTGGDRFNGIGELCPRAHRSEEHTSELQSQSNLVCRLLLEKKKHFICLLLTIHIVPMMFPHCSFPLAVTHFAPLPSLFVFIMTVTSLSLRSPCY